MGGEAEENGNKDKDEDKAWMQDYNASAPRSSS